VQPVARGGEADGCVFGVTLTPFPDTAVSPNAPLAAAPSSSSLSLPSLSQDGKALPSPTDGGGREGSGGAVGSGPEGVEPEEPPADTTTGAGRGDAACEALGSSASSEDKVGSSSRPGITEVLSAVMSPPPPPAPVRLGRGRVAGTAVSGCAARRSLPPWSAFWRAATAATSGGVGGGNRGASAVGNKPGGGGNRPGNEDSRAVEALAVLLHMPSPAAELVEAGVGRTACG